MQDRNEDLIKLGKHLKALREKKKLSLSAVAYRSGIEPSTLSRIEKASVEPKYLTLLGIAKALDLELAQLLDFQS